MQLKIHRTSQLKKAVFDIIVSFLWFCISDHVGSDHLFLSPHRKERERGWERLNRELWILIGTFTQLHLLRFTARTVWCRCHSFLMVHYFKLRTHRYSRLLKYDQRWLILFCVRSPIHFGFKFFFPTCAKMLAEEKKELEFCLCSVFLSLSTSQTVLCPNIMMTVK